MFAHRSILIVAFVLTGMLSALAQSTEPGQTAPSAAMPSAIEADATSDARLPPSSAAPESEAGARMPGAEGTAQSVQQDGPRHNPAEPPRIVAQPEVKEPATKAAETPGEHVPDGALSMPAASDSSSGNMASPSPSGSGADVPSSANKAASQPKSKSSTTEESGSSNAATSSPTTAGAPTAEPTADGAKAAAQQKDPQTPSERQPKLAVDSGGGAFAQAYRQVVLEPFAAKTGIKVIDTHGGGASGDLELLDGFELARGCASGELIELKLAELSTSTTASAAPDDYLDGALQPCGIAPLSWSNLFVYDPGKFENRAPRSIADVFDTRRFPGKRALPRDGRGLVEAVMVADGVAPGDVYAALETSDGINRVLKRLKSLAADIVWYERLSDAITLVRAGKASIAFTSNGHAFIEQARSGPLGLIWDGQILHATYFAIPKSASAEAHAKELIAFASGPEQLASLVRQIPYGPMRRSAIAGALGVRHAVTGQELATYLPTAPENMRTAVRFDPVWWEKNAERIETALRIVRQGPPLPQRP